MTARFVGFEDVAARMRGKSVAVVGSAPSVLENTPGYVDAHEVVVRVNNYKTGLAQGTRCDIFYSFFGNSIKKTVEDLRRDGVRLCMCKLPNSRPLHSDWHIEQGKKEGIDYRYIFRNRAGWWFCDTFIPDDARFLTKFELLGKHQPTTGFSAILDVLDCKPRSVYLTGFDFFSSGIHNVDEKWRPGNPADPICHRPDLESAWLALNAQRYRLKFDATLQSLIACEAL
jgi:hypothetical protein